MSRLLRGIKGLAAYTIARKLKRTARRLTRTFHGSPLETRKMPACQCDRWDKFAGEIITHCGGKGTTRYRISVRKTSVDKHGRHLPRPIYEADIATMQAKSDSDWTPHLWKTKRARLLEFLTEKAALRGSRAYVQKACRRSS